MKKVLLASSILAFSAGFASAEITLSGDARMGIIGGSGVDTGFTSRARVKFTMSGETDGGLSFGASFRADNAGKSATLTQGVGPDLLFGTPDDTYTLTNGGGAVSGQAGEVFISGAFGKLTMGDIDGAAQQAVGNVDGVGLTGLGDLNEAVYVHNLLDLTGTDPSAAYEYSSGAFTGIISVQNPNNDLFVGGVDLSPTYALGLKYAMGDYTFALGYESNDDVGISHVIIGANATFGAFTVKANVGQVSPGGTNDTQYHISGTYTADALSVTAFYGEEFGSDGAYGLGAAYDLGGGAKVVGGYASNGTDDAFDMGVSFSF